jgi:hypothetical protein
MFMERTVLLMAALAISAAGGAAQAAGPATAQGDTPVPAPAPAGPSATLRPALDSVLGTLNAIKTDKWKRGSVRDEAGQDIGSVVSDIQVNLPPLLRDADAAPSLVSKQIPVVRNVDALYDVLLRAVEAARIAAPSDQAEALTQALNTLSKARLAVYDQMQQTSIAQEKQITDLHATVQKQASFVCPAPPPPVPCPATPKPKKKTTKPPASTPQKPATPPAGTTQKSGL